MKKVVIIGAGPAGLTAAHELLKTGMYDVIILEKTSSPGGLSKTFEFNGNRVDIGGHRYYTNNDNVKALWREVLPQGESGMLIRNRYSHILYKGKCFPYPLKLSVQSARSLGISNCAEVALSYINAKLNLREENTLEDFYINRFGKKMYKIFFESYTNKLWGLRPDEMSPDWGKQRVQGVSLANSLVYSRKGKKERSLIDKFCYPTYGSGQLWNNMAYSVEKLGGKIKYYSEVVKISSIAKHDKEVIYRINGVVRTIKEDIIVSTMPLRNFVLSIDEAPEFVKKTASELRYRDIILVGICINKKYMGSLLKQNSLDNWIYLQEETVIAGRLQILNNWSEWLPMNSDCCLLELEYYCNQGDDLWNKSDKDILNIATNDLIHCRAVIYGSDIIANTVQRIENAYPVYDDAYKKIDIIKEWINGVDGIFCIGRNGQHHYNNMDHSMETAFRLINCLNKGVIDKKIIWNVNIGADYVENREIK